MGLGGPSREAGVGRVRSRSRGERQRGWIAVPKYCRAPNCFNTAGRPGDNRPVSFYEFPLTDGSRLQAWLRHAGREHWVPSCREHLRSECFTPACVLWRWGFRYLRLDVVPSVFPRAPPTTVSAGRSHFRGTTPPAFPTWAITRSPPSPLALTSRGRKVPKRREAGLPPPQEPAPLPRDPAVSAPGPVHVVVLGPAAARSEAPTSVLLAPRALPPATRARLGAALGALRRVRRLQGRHERHQAQPLQGSRLWVQQLCQASVRLTPADGRGNPTSGLPGPLLRTPQSRLCSPAPAVRDPELEGTGHPGPWELLGAQTPEPGECPF
ncbi:LOW QUALITY PROTEIN: THAP domain-containing protein 8 [Dugong dugon]